MTDMLTTKKRSALMSRIRSRGNAATELRLIAIMRAHKMAGWRRGSKLPGQPDFIFPDAHVAVFVDGDFWHGNTKKSHIPRSNVQYWRDKILRNKRRDTLVNRLLRSRGWRIVRFWQSSLNKQHAVARRLELVLEDARNASRRGHLG